MNARDEFEAWRHHALATLGRERDALAAQRERLQVPPPARLAGPDAEDIVRGLEDFLRRYACVEGSLELVRRESPGGTHYGEVLYAQRADGRPDTFFDFMKEPFARRARGLLEAQEGPCVLRARVELSAGGSEVTLLAGAALEARSEAGRLETSIERLEQRRASLAALELSHEPYGPQLASRVVRALKKAALHHDHRDYCGLGLFATPDGGFVYTRVHDGAYMDTDVVRRFKDEEQLTRWLAQQSDASLSDYAQESDAGLSGQGMRTFLNQTLTRERLEAFASAERGTGEP